MFFCTLDEEVGGLQKKFLQYHLKKCLEKLKEAKG